MGVEVGAASGITCKSRVARIDGTVEQEKRSLLTEVGMMCFVSDETGGDIA